jgi:hypothetical protein
MVNGAACCRCLCGFVAFVRERSYLVGQGTFMTARTPIAPLSMARPLAVLGAAAGLLTIAALGLWAWYGTTVFFEMLRAGFAACF